MTHAPDLTRGPRTRKVFSDKDMERMAALYYDPAVPVQKVADAFDVPVSTFLRWISEMGWPRRRERRDFALVENDVTATLRQPEPGLTPQPYAARGRAPSLINALKRASQLARRELDAAYKMVPRTMEDRERIAKLVDSLSRSLARVQKSIDYETYNGRYDPPR
jgi:transposase-like protein